MATDCAGAKPFVTSFQGKTEITSNDFLVIFKKFDKDDIVKAGDLLYKPLATVTTTEKKDAKYKGNGYIEAGELDDFLVALCKESTKEENVDKKAVEDMKEEILRKYDMNFDGRLDLEELTRILPTEENFLVQFQHHVSLTSVEFFKVWNHYDQDHSGFIESDELKGFLSDLLGREGQSLTPQRIDDYAMAMLDLFDGNKDGRLSLSEMSKILPVEENFLKKFGGGKYSEEDFNQIWSKYDEDKNGFISDEELEALVHDLALLSSKQGETKTDDPAALKAFKAFLMKVYDTDNDGKIKYEELKLMMLGEGR